MGAFGGFPFGGGPFGGGSSTSVAGVNGSFNDPIDSYYNYIVGQMKLIAPSQLMGGYVLARDWPLSPVISNALYLLFLGTAPFRNVGYPPSQTQLLYVARCQWTWLLIGTDIKSNQQAENRGDRYRKNMQIMTNLRQASYASFCPKRTFSVDSEGNLSSLLTTTEAPHTEIESIWWSHPKFIPRQDNDKSGLLYGAAQVEIFSYDDVFSSVA